MNKEFEMPCKIIKELEKTYNSIDRKYHNLKHIYRMLSDYESFKDCQSGFEYMLLYGVPYKDGKMDSYSNDMFMFWIIWFHDFVYQGLPTDEIRSAYEASHRFFKTFQLEYSLELDMNIVLPIYSTQHRGVICEMLEGHKYGFAKLLCDLDLMPLSDHWDFYMKHSEDIMTEARLLYRGMHSKTELIRKRAAWLHSFLKRKTIYQIPHYQFLNENSAVANMVKELEEIIKCYDFAIPTMADFENIIQQRKEELKSQGILIAKDKV